MKLSLNACYFAGKGILFMEELRDDGFFEYANGLLARAGIIDPNEREIIGRWINSTSSTLGVCDVVSIKKFVGLIFLFCANAR